MNHADARMEHSAKEPNDPCAGCRGFSRTLSSFHSGDIQAGNMVEGTLEVQLLTTTATTTPTA